MKSRYLQIYSHITFDRFHQENKRKSHGNKPDKELEKKKQIKGFRLERLQLFRDSKYSDPHSILLLRFLIV